MKAEKEIPEPTLSKIGGHELLMIQQLDQEIDEKIKKRDGLIKYLHENIENVDPDLKKYVPYCIMGFTEISCEEKDCPVHGGKNER